MNYQRTYDNLIETRRHRVLEKEVYYENHHVVMKSMGGTNEPRNLVKLTAREHFLAHWLLWRIHGNRQTAYAFNAFTGLFAGKNFENRPKITSSRGYAEAREAYSKLHSERMTGVLNSNRSKIVIQCDLQGNEIREWPSAKEAHRELDISHITAVCRGERKWAGGFKWKYRDGYVARVGKVYKKRISSKKTKPSSTKNISKAAKGGKWYTNGAQDFWVSIYATEAGEMPANSYPGRSQLTRKQ